MYDCRDSDRFNGWQDSEPRPVIDPTGQSNNTGKGLKGPDVWRYARDKERAVHGG
ncbi:MAG TPA: hypothetical protein VKR06_18915 [Ktedonosporobacter sp.]|nr:hypothetical protein [Ktedonosporobacter sp.]